MDELGITVDTAASKGISVHAGFPNPAVDRANAALSLDKLLIRSPISTYFFRVRGHHWHRYGVFDGDIAIIDRAPTPNNHDMVVWWEESGEFYLMPFGQSGRNTIWGTVTAIIHPYRHTALTSDQR